MQDILPWPSHIYCLYPVGSWVKWAWMCRFIVWPKAFLRQHQLLESTTSVQEKVSLVFKVNSVQQWIKNAFGYSYLIRIIERVAIWGTITWVGGSTKWIRGILLRLSCARSEEQRKSDNTPNFVRIQFLFLGLWVYKEIKNELLAVRPLAACLQCLMKDTCVWEFFQDVCEGPEYKKVKMKMMNFKIIIL